MYKPSAHYFDTFYGSFTAVALEADGANTSHPLTISRAIESLEWVAHGRSRERGGACCTRARERGGGISRGGSCRLESDSLVRV